MVGKSMLSYLLMGLLLISQCFWSETTSTDGSSIGNVLFEDDFSTDKGWTSSPPSDIARDPSENNVRWHVDRSYDQRMYRSIDPVTGDFKFKVDLMILDATNNNDLRVGLVDDINNLLSSSGLFVQIGYYGGGTPYQHWYALVSGRYCDGTVFTSATGDVTPSEDTWSGYISLSPGIWYSCELSKTGSSYELKVYDANGGLVGSLSGEIPGCLAPFKYVYIGNYDTKDWPTANGRLDNILIYNEDQPSLADKRDLTGAGRAVLLAVEPEDQPSLAVEPGSQFYLTIAATGYGTWTGMQMTYLPSPVQRNTLVTFAATQPA